MEVSLVPPPSSLTLSEFFLLVTDEDYGSTHNPNIINFNTNNT